MKKFLLSLLAIMATWVTSLAADEKTMTLDFTPNTNPQGYPSAQVTSEKTVTYEGVNYTFMNAWWNKSKSNSHIATKKGEANAYLKVGPFEGKTITSIQLYIPSGVTAKSKFDLFYGEETSSIGQFTFSATPGESNTIAIPEGKQNGIFKFKTANTGNQCGIGKIIITYTEGNEGGDKPVEAPASLTITAGDQTFEEDGDYSIDEGTAVSISAPGATEIKVDDEVLANGETATWTPAVGEYVSTITASNAAGSISRTFSLTVKKVYPTECPTPAFYVNGTKVSGENAEVAAGAIITVKCPGAETLIWTVNDGDMLGFEDSYTVTEAPATELSLYALASVTGENGEITAEATAKLTVSNILSTTFDFSTNDYGLDPKEGTAYESSPATIKNGKVRIILRGEDKFRLWKNDRTLRLYKDASMEVIVPSNCYITEITMAPSNIALTTPKGIIDGKSWTPASAEDRIFNVELTREVSKSYNINTITVKYARMNEADAPATTTLVCEKPSYDAAYKDLTVDYSINVSNHKEGNIYYAELSLKSTNGNSEFAPVTILNNVHHPQKWSDMVTPTQIASRAEGATDKVWGQVTFHNVPENEVFTLTTRHGLAEDELSEPEVVSYLDVSTSIAEIEAAGEGAIEWYDLSGRRVLAPVHGVYLMKQGSKVSKKTF